MAEYKGIKGFKVQYLSADPSNPIIGQTWYNSTSKDLKFTELAPGSWASTGSLNTAKYYLAAAGTTSAALAFGGTSPGSAASNTSEAYNGSTWSGAPNMNTGRRDLGGNGATQDAALAYGGATPTLQNASEEYNGASWSSGNPINFTTRTIRGCGTQTAALAFGAEPASANTEEYDGTSWVTVNSLNTARRNAAAFGTQTAGVAANGNPPVSLVEEYDGTSWTTVPGVTNQPAGGEICGFGIQTAGLVFGFNPPSNVAETYDGTSWSVTANMATNRWAAAAAGTTSASGLAIGGEPAFLSAVEEYIGAGPATKTITVS